MQSTSDILRYLRPGCRAKVVAPENYSGIIVKKEDGSVVWEGCGEHFALTPEAMQLKWEIINDSIPKYETVSFLQAYDAYQRDKKIGFYDEEENFYSVPSDLNVFYWEEILSNRWVILE